MDNHLVVSIQAESELNLHVFSEGVFFNFISVAVNDVHLLFAVVGNFADLKDVSLVSELFLIFVGKFDFVGVKEMLETADGECSFSIEDDVIF